jgi:hypothetical protein
MSDWARLDGCNTTPVTTTVGTEVKTTTQIDATALILDFFGRHHLG